LIKAADGQGDTPQDSVKRCIALLIGGGRTAGEAARICEAVPNLASKPAGWDEKLWNQVKKFSKVKAAAGDQHTHQPVAGNDSEPVTHSHDAPKEHAHPGLQPAVYGPPNDVGGPGMKKSKASMNFKGVEIARTGKFDASTGPVTFTTDDFDNATEAFRALGGKHRAPIKLGHDDGQALLGGGQEDGMPNAGFVVNVRRADDRLVADLVDVPDGVAKLIQDGRLNARSIEALRNARLDGKRWPFVVTGLALLGSDLPAVDSLADVQALYASQGIEIPTTDDDEAEVIIAALTEDGSPAEAVDHILSELDALMTRAESIIRRQGGAPKLRTLVAAAKDELRAIAKKKNATRKVAAIVDLKKLASKLGLEETATEDEVLAKLDEQIEALKLKAKKGDEDEGEGEDEEGLKAELIEARKEIIVLKDRAANEDATKDVDKAIKAGKFAPASRDTLIKLAVSSPAEFGKLVKATPDNIILAKKGETGGDGDGSGGEIGDLEPTTHELAIGKQIGVSREELVEAKARKAGVPVPESVAKVLVAARAAKTK